MRDRERRDKGSAYRFTRAFRVLRLATFVRFDEAHESIKHVIGVGSRCTRMRIGIVRPGARFRMPLKAERRTVGAGESLQAAVEERGVGDARGRRKRRGIDCEAVVLTRDYDASILDVLNRMVRTVVAELHLDGFRAARESKQLVPEANAEHGYPGIEQLLDGAYRVITRLRITGTVRQEHPIRSERKH